MGRLITSVGKKGRRERQKDRKTERKKETGKRKLVAKLPKKKMKISFSNNSAEKLKE